MTTGPLDPHSGDQRDTSVDDPESFPAVHKVSLTFSTTITLTTTLTADEADTLFRAHWRHTLQSESVEAVFRTIDLRTRRVEVGIDEDSLVVREVQ